MREELRMRRLRPGKSFSTLRKRRRPVAKKKKKEKEHGAKWGQRKRQIGSSIKFCQSSRNVTRTLQLCKHEGPSRPPRRARPTGFLPFFAFPFWLFALHSITKLRSQKMCVRLHIWPNAANPASSGGVWLRRIWQISPPPREPRVSWFSGTKVGWECTWSVSTLKQGKPLVYEFGCQPDENNPRGEILLPRKWFENIFTE